MDHKNQRVLEKILSHINSVMEYCRDCSSLQDFQSDTMLVEATVFNLMQIGELAKNSLDDETKARITTIPWTQIYGMRNRIVHGYSGINLSIVWDTISNDIPKLREELTSILRNMS